jgi:hypothetical protein
MGSLQMKEYLERLYTELVKAQLRAQLYEGIYQDIEDTSLINGRGKRTRLVCVYNVNRLRDMIIYMKETFIDNVKRTILRSNVRRDV